MNREDVEAGADPVKMETKKLMMVLGKGLTGRILGILASETYLSASEIASRLEIHIATAQKYLYEMKDAGLVSSRYRKAPTRPTEEYWLSKEKIKIEIDLRSKTGVKDMEHLANSLMVFRNDKVKVALDSDERRKTVSEILILGKGDRPSISKRMKLDNVEGRFAWEIATSGGARGTVMEMAKKANITRSQLPQIMKLVDKLSDIGYVGSEKDVECKKEGEKND